MKILFLSRWYPLPPDNGSRIRIYNLLRQLALQHDLSLVAFGTPAQAAETAACTSVEFPDGSVRAKVLPYREFRQTSAKAILGLLSPQPRYLVDTFRAEMDRVIAVEVARFRPDLIVASQLAMVPYALRVASIPLLLEELEVSRFREGIENAPSHAGRIRAQLTWLKLSAYVRAVLPRFAACTVVSPDEREQVKLVAPHYTRVAVIPNAIDLAQYRGNFGAPRPNTLLYSGSITYDANRDAVRYFLSDIFPLILRTVPDVLFRVSGSYTETELATLPSSPGLVEFTGHVPDVRPLVAQSWVSVVPLRLGGGTRLKILEAMALGTPVVSTSKGAAGLAVTDGENILLADDPHAFANKIISVLRSPALRQRLSEGGRRLVAAHYDWQLVGEQFDKLVCLARRNSVQPNRHQESRSRYGT